MWTLTRGQGASSIATAPARFYLVSLYLSNQLGTTEEEKHWTIRLPMGGFKHPTATPLRPPIVRSRNLVLRIIEPFNRQRAVIPRRDRTLYSYHRIKQSSEQSDCL
ncbi:hypothetical protein HRR83_005095 [Exophiala dermatitidis]|uniref:Uncharacterized protein n=1 Tax=Exophiala dermatitidis TaxID=5970 RepID=A0AAN6EUS4_EXODE|nr:hypothetical protein HRR74_004740 [Exophiala dermatitidis]KAJ4519830.1 hypothetical protein HRR73_003891 [Exophiala dermatitidis]KAJ4534362.1 hypothetical protein HRR76_006290 [Exophiala dermatitidis]KAJ4541416.1 hypothetical protein HRR77_006209 [Exophiala dermatitidis]KAJ4564040.1 hypothetical protein HRR79_006068 [Exophiala dermatitidis]